GSCARSRAGSSTGCSTGWWVWRETSCCDPSDPSHIRPELQPSALAADEAIMSPGKGARRLLSADGGVWSLNIAIVIASVVLLAGPVQHLPEFDVGVHIPWWGLALGFLAAERCVVHLHFRRSAHSF